MKAAEKTRWDLANKGKIFNLENNIEEQPIKSNNYCIIDDSCVPFYFLFTL
jgi:hypothetical protein